MVKVKIRDGWKSVRANGDLVLCSALSCGDGDYYGRSILVGKANTLELAYALAHIIADTATQCFDSEGEAAEFFELLSEKVNELLDEGGEDGNRGSEKGIPEVQETDAGRGEDQAIQPRI